MWMGTDGKSPAGLSTLAHRASAGLPSSYSPNTVEKAKPQSESHVPDTLSTNAHGASDELRARSGREVAPDPRDEEATALRSTNQCLPFPQHSNAASSWRWRLRLPWLRRTAERGGDA